MPPLTDKNVIRAEFQDVARKYIGLGRAMSVAEVSDSLGDSPSTIKKWLAGESTPQWPSMYRLMQLFPEMANELMDGMAAAADPICPHKAHATVAQLNALHAKHMEDGELCAAEIRQQVPLARRVIVVLTNFVRGGA